MAATRIDAILFDFDGTLLDTNELITQTFLAILNDYYPGRFTREDCLEFNGPTLKQTFEALDPSRSEEMIEAYRTLNAALHDEMAQPFEGVTETLRLLRARGVPMAIVTSKRRPMVERGMRLMDIEGLISVLVSADDVAEPKPDPEGVLAACRALGVEPARALMVGDNRHDIEAGKRGGSLTAGVAWSQRGESYMASLAPDYVLRTMGDLLPLLEEGRG